MKKITITQKKYDAIKRLSNNEDVVASLAIDQRGSLKRMLGGDVDGVENVISNFKELVSTELTPYASSILLDPVYGLPAANKRDDDAGLLLAYEVTGYDKDVPGRLPRIINTLSVQRLKEEGTDGIKFLLYYDVDEGEEINEQKHALMERVGGECAANDMPFFLEILTYDANIENNKGKEFAKVKPQKVIPAMEEFSKEKYHVDVLKVEVPVNMNYVEGYTEDEPVHTKDEAAKYFKEQSESTHVPFIFLSAGVTMELFNESLKLAYESGSDFNGVLCGRATWKESVDIFVSEGEEAAVEWLQTQGKENIQSLNEVLEDTAKPFTDAYEIID